MSKRVGVSHLIDFANKQLARTDADLEFKAGICTMIQEVLFKSGNYEGFLFLDNSDSEVETWGYYTRRYLKSGKLA